MKQEDEDTKQRRYRAASRLGGALKRTIILDCDGDTKLDERRTVFIRPAKMQGARENRPWFGIPADMAEDDFLLLFCSDGTHLVFSGDDLFRYDGRLHTDSKGRRVPYVHRDEYGDWLLTLKDGEVKELDGCENGFNKITDQI